MCVQVPKYLTVCTVVQDSANHGDELLQQSSELSRLQSLVERLQAEQLQYKERIKKESAKVKQLEGDKMSESILTEGVTRELEKVIEFLCTIHWGCLVTDYTVPLFSA